MHVSGRIEEICASREVIVAASSVNTPKLLMLSGIGPAEHRAEMGVPLVRDLPERWRRTFENRAFALGMNDRVAGLVHEDVASCCVLESGTGREIVGAAEFAGRIVVDELLVGLVRVEDVFLGFDDDDDVQQIFTNMG